MKVVLFISKGIKKRVPFRLEMVNKRARLGEEVGGEGLPSLKKPPDPGGAQKCFIRGGSGLALFFTSKIK